MSGGIRLLPEKRQTSETTDLAGTPGDPRHSELAPLSPVPGHGDLIDRRTILGLALERRISENRIATHTGAMQSGAGAGCELLHKLHSSVTLSDAERGQIVIIACDKAAEKFAASRGLDCVPLIQGDQQNDPFVVFLKELPPYSERKGAPEMASNAGSPIQFEPEAVEPLLQRRLICVMGAAEDMAMYGRFCSIVNLQLTRALILERCLYMGFALTDSEGRKIHANQATADNLCMDMGITNGQDAT